MSRRRFVLVDSVYKFVKDSTSYTLSSYNRVYGYTITDSISMKYSDVIEWNEPYMAYRYSTENSSYTYINYKLIKKC